MTHATGPALRARAEQHRLLGDETRLLILDALAEGPRTVHELARLADVHPNTVRAHLGRLTEAGLVGAATSLPSARGRPSLRYALRDPQPLSGSEFRMLVAALSRLVARAYAGGASAFAEAEGRTVGLSLARRRRYASPEQVVDQVLMVLRQLSFAPELVRDRGRDRYRFMLRACPFDIRAGDHDGAIVCAFHLGLIRGVAEGVGSAGIRRVDLLPHVDATTCEAWIEVDGSAGAGEAAGAVAGG